MHFVKIFQDNLFIFSKNVNVKGSHLQGLELFSLFLLFEFSVLVKHHSKRLPTRWPTKEGKNDSIQLY